MGDSLKTIPVNKIRENPVALRTVNRNSEEYLGLVDSVRRNGILNPILVREVKDPSTGETLYGLIDGLHRFSASQDAGLAEIPAHIKSMEDAEILEAQVLANVHKVETKPVEYAKQLTRILSQNPLLTANELATRLSKSSSWLGERLGLTKLSENISSLVDEGKINLSNAYALAKLPVEEQPNFLDRAQTMSPQEFVPTCTARVKEIRDAKRAGRDAAPAQFVPVPHLRKMSELKDELESGNVANILIHKFNAHTPNAAAKLMLEWALHLDPESIESAKAKDAARKQELKDAADKRKIEREKKKAEEAAANAAAAGAAG